MRATQCGLDGMHPRYDRRAKMGVRECARPSPDASRLSCPKSPIDAIRLRSRVSFPERQELTLPGEHSRAGCSKRYSQPSPDRLWPAGQIPRWRALWKRRDKILAGTVAAGITSFKLTSQSMNVT